MSVTLSDAQGLCWKNFRKINEKLNLKRGKNWTPYVMVTELLAEAGDLARLVKGLEGFEPPDKPITKEMLAAELSDIMYIVFVAASHYEVRLDELFIQNVNDYVLRFLK